MLSFAPDLARAEASYPASYHEEIHRLESGHFWFQGRNRLILWAIRRHFPEVRSFLEVGCGTGFVLSAIQKALPKAEIFGGEMFSEGLSFAAARTPGATLLQLDARRIPFRDHFDLIGAFDVIEHIREDELVLSEMCRALRPSGGLLLTVPQHPWLWSPVDDFAGHVRRYRKRELVAKVEAAGFEVLFATSFVTFLLPLMLLSRLSKRNLAKAEAELRIGSMANAIGGAFFSLERAMVGSGINLPAGGSLLLAARRRD